MASLETAETVRGELKTIVVLDPVGIAKPKDESLAPRLDELAGKTICLLDNTKPNFDIFLQTVAESLREQYHPKEILNWRKVNPSSPAGSILDKISESCQAVITGSGD